MTNSYEFAGDFSLLEVNLYPLNGQKINIKPLVLEITLYESVFSSALQAELSIQDIGKNLINTLPLVGQERVEIIISSDGFYYTLNYYIYSIDGRAMKEKNQVYIMHCVSIEAMRNENFRICERIDGRLSHEYIGEILKRDNFTDKKFHNDSTVFPFNMYVPNWRPFDLFNWMSTRSVPDYKKDSVGYLFYETLTGFHFKSIDVLLDQEVYPKKGFVYNYNQGNTESDSSSEKYRINKYASPNVFNIYDDLRRGAFCHNSIYVDINRRTYRVFKSTVDEFWKDSSHADNVKPYVTKGGVQLLERGSRFVYRPTTQSTWGNWTENIQNTEKENIDDVNKNFEKAFFRYYFLEYSHLDISVPGDLRNRCGNMIEVSIPSPEKTESGRPKIDERISGKYMVSAIKHTILNRSELRTTVTLSRDTFGGDTIPDTFTGNSQINLDGIN